MSFLSLIVHKSLISAKTNFLNYYLIVFRWSNDGRKKGTTRWNSYPVVHLHNLLTNIINNLNKEGCFDKRKYFLRCALFLYFSLRKFVHKSFNIVNSSLLNCYLVVFRWRNAGPLNGTKRFIFDPLVYLHHLLTMN